MAHSGKSILRRKHGAKFFIQQRLQVQVRVAADNNLLDKRDLDSFERLYKHIGELFAEEPNVLLHGDLWSGNLCVMLMINLSYLIRRYIMDHAMWILP
jgi:fructosamine-3-kinase